MSEVTILLKAYVLKKISHQIALTSAEQIKSNQFDNLLTICNISPEFGFNLPEKERLNEYCLFFLDFSSFSHVNEIPNNILGLVKNHKVALFNCQPELLCEKTVLLSGVHGVFYANDRVGIILKGIENLLNDERWFKRETMNDAIGELLSSNHFTQQNHDIVAADNVIFPTLTKREKTIITLVSSGAQNKEIANQLHISPNTVKTHIYSIFRKTSSRNRIELVSWSKQFQQLN